MTVIPASIRDRKPPPDAPPEGRYRVTIRVERPDGQFVTSSRLLPDNLLGSGGADDGIAQDWAVREIGAAFVGAYRRAAELPE
jgi:hypothetical protein